MVTSGTTSFNLNLIEAIEEAFERAGLESRSGYDMRSARRSINLMMLDWANRGLNMWLYEERSKALTAGVSGYELGNDIIDVIEQLIEIPYTTQTTRYNLSRVSISTQASRTNPGITGRPTEVYFDRSRDAPVAYVWPLPDTTGYTLVYWVLRRVEDAGSFTNTTDLPFRFLPAFIAGLAFYIAQKKQQANPELIARLENDYERTWLRASEEDREKATLMMTPRGSSYRVVN